MLAYQHLDGALASMSFAGPELRSGLTNHGPMVAEALCAMGRGEAVSHWVEAYRKELLPWPTPRERIERGGWRTALGRPGSAGDWHAFFASELQEAPWREVLERWTARLAPGLSADATHGVIRAGHAARALGLAQTPGRLAELGGALAAWASTYQQLPAAPPDQPPWRRPAEAILEVAAVPPSQRGPTTTIVAALERLRDFPAFAPAIGLADLDGDPPAVISELTETFARVFLANARDPLTAIVFTHGVTSCAALRSLLPHVGAQTARDAIRHGWQAGCALYAAFGVRPVPPHQVEPPRESRDALIDLAVAHWDEHAIKLTEACLREHALNPSPAYLAAARHALGTLPRPRHT